MAKKPEEWLVTQTVTAERLSPKEESGFGGVVWAIVIILILIGMFGGH